MSILKARESFAYTDPQGLPQIVRAGDLLSSDDPALKGRDHLFEPVAVKPPTVVEDASAEPGRSRPMRRGRSRRGEEPGIEAWLEAEKQYLAQQSGNDSP
ncbi:hypothetical protein [Mycolicibacterium vaccae]|uniref:hypothetical protein n=1 Tax=Mycolicibacterium vaccae TaxID=1810 RepID=UPI003CFC98BC